ncbi:MAG TPA: acylphosphatase [Candidatus Brocadiia bacterium]|nr:acylphosphatase [Candidatus Brocadiia bacterium]
MRDANSRNDDKITVHVVIEGLVQGVGFRYATRRFAADHDLGGWVKNRPDGRVEALFEGRRSAVQAAVDWCRKGPPASRVENVNVTYLQSEGRSDGFRIASGK